MIDVLDANLRNSTGAMVRFVRAYLVLAMALATGEIHPDQIQDRGDYRSLIEPEEGENPHPFFNCIKRHPHAEIFCGNSAAIIPLKLGISLIGIGYEESKKINQSLRSTGQFTGEKEIPLWLRFVEWRIMPKEELESTFVEAKAYVLRSDVIKPGPYLHLSHDIIRIYESGFGNADETREEIIGRIDTLSKEKKIPAAEYGMDFGWDTRGGTFSFGGYAFTPNENIEPIIDAMRRAQILAFNEVQPEKTEHLLLLLRDDLEAFGQEFTGGIGKKGYYCTEILYEIDVCKFAEYVFEHLTSGRFDAVGRQIMALAGC